MMVRTERTNITAAQARELLEKLEAARGLGKVLVCSPGIAGRLIVKYRAESLEELDGMLGVGVLPLAFVADNRPGIIGKKAVENCFFHVIQPADRERLGLEEPGAWLTWTGGG